MGAVPDDFGFAMSMTYSLRQFRGVVGATGGVNLVVQKVT